MRKKIYFRTDGNTDIGFGHVIRSLALADMLKDHFECIFATRFVNKYIIEEIEKSCSSYIKLKEGHNEHFDEFLACVSKEDIVVLDNYLIALGGRNTSYHEDDDFAAFFKTAINTVDYFDFSTHEWSTFKEVLPNPAAGSGTVVLDNELYFFGGETAKKEANKLMFSFNLKDKNWKQKPSLNIGRHGTNAAVLNDKIYIASGSGNQGGGPELTSIEIYK